MSSRNLKNSQRFLIKVALSVITFASPLMANAQNPFGNFQNLFTVPKGYTVTHINKPIAIDGNIDKPAWQNARWSDDFVDIEGDLKPKPSLQTNVKMLWDDSTLYIAGQIRDPNVWAYLKHHDDIVFGDNDFEIFIDPENTTHQYFELEFNAINTVFDLFLNKPYRNNGNALISWDTKGLRLAVKIQGTLNNPGDVDKGWTVEVAIPFKALSMLNDVRPPSEGSEWRINFSRVEWDTKVAGGKYVKLKDNAGNNLPEHNWVWSPQGVINMHYPERWGYLKFTRLDSNDDKAFELPYAEQQKKYLWLIYYNEQAWFNKNYRYEPSLSKFDLADKVTIDGHANNLKIEATRHQFMALITDEENKVTWTINNEGLISRLKTKADE